MAVRIAHASIDENKKTTGGTAGDQTGKEVCVRSWYSGGWEFVARPKNQVLAENIDTAAEAGCNNPNVGYDQGGRNTLLNAAKAVDFDLSKIANACESDCSSFVSVCVRAALGWNFYTGNAPTTRTLKSVLKGTGEFEILEDSKYLTSDKYLRRGDILCKAGSHTVMVLDNGSAASTQVSAPAAATTSKVDYTMEMRKLKKGCTGEDVKALQILLIGRGYDCGKYGADGDFGAATDKAVRAFQKDKGQTVDGVAGKATMSGLLGV